MPSHQDALDQLHRVADESGGVIQVVTEAHQPDRFGQLDVELSLDCSRVVQEAGGLRLDAREHAIVRIPAEFPFRHPRVWVLHTRFAGAPHVQWVNVRLSDDQQGNEICLYQAPSVEWSPSDGMLGLLERLLQWYKRAAVGALDAPGQPLHPPVAYPTPGAGCVVVLANAPRAGDADAPEPRRALALMRWVAPWRADVLDWLEDVAALDELWPVNEQEARALPGRLRELAGVGEGDARVFLGLAFVLPRPTVFELPNTTRDLIDALERQGLQATELLGLMATTALLNTAVPGDVGLPLYVLVGSPPRGRAGDGQRITHLNALRLHELDAEALSYLPFGGSQVPELEAIARAVAADANDWLERGGIAWAAVFDKRPELVVRRDVESPACWLRDRKVMVLGCGALGAPIAEQCVRGGVGELTLVDDGVVHPGILVRQPYLDAEVGLAKAEVLAERLRRIRPDVMITAKLADAVDTVLRDGAGVPDVDLVVDATANVTVATKLERDRWPDRRRWPPVASVAIGHKAERGVATLSLPGATGAGVDVLRRLGLTARADPGGRLADVVDDLFPQPPRTDLFHPEPGCSEPTFVGSASQVAALASQLFNGILGTLAGDEAEPTTKSMWAYVVRLSTMVAATPPLTWEDDLVMQDPTTGYEIRIAPPALATMQAECGDAARRHGLLVETGGRLFGQVDNACRVVWVSSASNPPPDSERSSQRFRLGVAGVPELLASYDAVSGGLARLVGEWHTHPGGIATESTTDHEAMTVLLTPVGPVLSQELLLILGGPPSRWAAWLDRGEPPELYVRLARRDG
ncbi:MAG TPA: ThiF family adenylyltransferase [Actinomycetes bacterium]|nr:ThiF family adenylyltransferase [Actinomycetes bacterium]